MSVNTNDLVNINSGKEAHVCGLGPSLKNYLEKIEKIDRGLNLVFSVKSNT
jgi:hypothetical protein